LQQVAVDTVPPSAEHIECVAKAVETILSSLLGEAPVRADEEATQESLKCNGVVGVIGLVGDVEWSLVVGIPRETAPKLAEGFTGFEIPFESEDMGDAIGELTNLVAGDVKVNLDRLGVASEISLPQVLRGEGIELLRPPRVPSVILSFESSYGPFWVALTTAGE